jgi:adenylate cyclase
MRRFSFRPLILGVLVGIAAAFGFASGALRSWSDALSDRFFVAHEPDPSIVVVAIDDVSIQKIGRWPWDRTVHADLINRISAGQPLVIGYDVNFPEPQDPENDSALAEAIRHAGNVILPVEYVVDEGNDVYVTKSTPVISEVAADHGITNVYPDEDGVVRRQTSKDAMRSFAESIALRAGRPPIAPWTSDEKEGSPRINFPGMPGSAFPAISAKDILNGKTDASRFAGKMVLVGATAPDLHDEQIVPTSRGTPMPGVEIHASILDTFLSQRWLHDVPGKMQMALLILLAVVVSILASLFRGRWSAPLVTTVWAMVLAAAFFLFDRGWVLDVVWPTLTIIATYAIVTLERRARAEHDRRELKGMFSRYVSASVVDAIIQDPKRLELGGERRRMSVFFSDIRGFTTLAEGMSPEKLVKLLNAYLDRMTDLVFSHGGVLDKYIGDAVMAFWNAPFDQPDHARRAAATAIAMREALAEMNASHAFGKADLKIGVGINTGDMVVGNIGGHQRFDYTVIGDNVNLASRVEGLTKEYGVEILLTEATAIEAGSEILSRRLDLVVVKGKTEPVAVYEAMALSERASPAQTRLAHDYEHAFSRYLVQDFVGASGVCADILSRHSDDGPTKVLLQRCAAFIQNPPAKDWNGAWVYTKK